MLWIGATIVAAMAAAAILAPAISPYDPDAITGGPLTAPSWSHWLGTNDIGQDVLSQLLWGARSSMTLAGSSAVLAIFIGMLVGVTVPLLGGITDAVVTRVIDVFLALPALPLLLVTVSLAGPRRTVVILVIALFSWPRVARMLRSEALSVAARDFVDASRGFGAGPSYLVRRHLVPAVGPLIGTSFIEVAAAGIFLDAGLAYLGLGDPTASSWGLMLNRATNYPGLYFTDAWTWLILPPGIAVTLAVLGVTFLWIGAEGRFNPRLGGESEPLLADRVA